jgi:hypothetical protein
VGIRTGRISKYTKKPILSANLSGRSYVTKTTKSKAKDAAKKKSRRKVKT